MSRIVNMFITPIGDIAEFDKISFIVNNEIVSGVVKEIDVEEKTIKITFTEIEALKLRMVTGNLGTGYRLKQEDK